MRNENCTGEYFSLSLYKQKKLNSIDCTIQYIQYTNRMIMNTTLTGMNETVTNFREINVLPSGKHFYDDSWI